MVMMTTMTMRLQFRVTSASGSSLLDIFEPWSGSGCPLLPDPSAYQVILISFGGSFQLLEYQMVWWEGQINQGLAAALKAPPVVCTLPW